MSDLQLQMSVLKMPVLDNHGKPFDTSKSCGVLDFLEGSHDSETTLHSEPFLFGWFLLEPAEFDDLWERVKNRTIGKSLVSLRISGIKNLQIMSINGK